MKAKSFIYLLIFPLLLCINCSKDKINPYVVLSGIRYNAIVNFSNEGTQVSGFTHYTTSITHGGGDAIVTRVFSEVIYRNYITSYRENRSYDPGGTYSIFVYDIVGSNGLVKHFTAEVDGVEYHYR